MRDNMLNQVSKRTASYWYVDGLAEIGTGLLFVVLGVFYVILSSFPSGGATALAVGIGQPVIILVGIWSVSKGVHWLKERITFPRTGYVSYRQKPKSKRRQTAILAGTVAAVIAVLIIVVRLEGLTIWLAAGLLSALVPIMLGLRLGLPRFYIIAVLIAALSFGIFFLAPQAEMIEAVLFYGGLGVILLLSGGITLWRYLQTSRTEEPEVQDE